MLFKVAQDMLKCFNWPILWINVNTHHSRQHICQIINNNKRQHIVKRGHFNMQHRQCTEQCVQESQLPVDRIQSPQPLVRIGSRYDDRFSVYCLHIIPHFRHALHLCITFGHRMKNGKLWMKHEIAKASNEGSKFALKAPFVLAESLWGHISLEAPKVRRNF